MIVFSLKRWARVKSGSLERGALFCAFHPSTVEKGLKDDLDLAHYDELQSEWRYDSPIFYLTPCKLETDIKVL